MSEPRRDRWGRYLLPDPETGEERAWTRATTLAKALDDTYNVQRWAERMTAKGVAIRDDLRALARATPLEDKSTLDKVARDAKEAAGGSHGRNVGNALHAFTAQLDTGQEIDPPYPYDADLRVYRETMQKYGVVVIPDLVEQIVACPELGVAGTFDRVVTFALEWYIADVKTGASLEWSWPSIAIQLAVYARARYLWNDEGRSWEAMPRVNQHRALVIHLPEARAECTLWWLDIAAGWQAANLARNVREWQKREGLAWPIGVDMLTQPALQIVGEPVPREGREGGAEPAGNGAGGDLITRDPPLADTHDDATSSGERETVTGQPPNGAGVALPSPVEVEPGGGERP